MATNNNNNTVFIGPKEIKHYITGCFFALSRSPEIKIKARGKNNKTALDVLEILKRVYLDSPEYNILVDTDEFKDESGEIRKVTTLVITLSGTLKKEKFKK